MKSFTSKPRVTITASTSELYEISAPASPGFPAVVSGQSGVSLVDWAQAESGLIKDELTRHGALLFRGFYVGGEKGFTQFVKTVNKTSLEPMVGDQDLIDDFAAPSLNVQFHHEYADKEVWPKRVFYHCESNTTLEGGQTPIVDGRLLFEKLKDSVLPCFPEAKYRVFRQFGKGISKPWSSAFKSQDRDYVHSLCEKWGYSVRWEGDCLQIEKTMDLVLSDEQGLNPSWANVVCFYDHRNFTVGEVDFSKSYSHDELPSHVTYIDGKLIEDHVIDKINEAYSQCTALFDWREGDVLLLDNHRFAHGRKAFTGKQKILISI